MVKIKLFNWKLLLIIFIASLLRLYGINWDQGHHLHPDERMIMMVADSIKFFGNLNPHFYNYGSLPIYVLKGISQLMGIFNPYFPTYDGMLVVGRTLSVAFDLITILLVYKITQLLFNKVQVAVYAAFFYAIAFFPIQNSHFYTVDTLLTTLTTLLIYLLLKYFDMRRSSHIKYSFFIGIVFAAMLATKFTAVIFYPFIVVYLFLTVKQWSNQAISFLIFNFSFLIFNFIFMPYALFDRQKFLSDISSQIQMNSNPHIFPYTLQYVGTTPYWYHLKNIFLWGLGPFISVISIFGLICLIGSIIKFKKNLIIYILFIIFYIFYFLIIGHSAVKFMRYMLPVYPFLAIMAGYGFSKISNIKYQISKLIVVLAILWTYIFLNIYSQPHTRIAATDWILKNISAGSSIAVEHWDDRLPLTKSEQYKISELTLYDYPDDNMKWTKINRVLNDSQYIIIASNRLYVPLQKLVNCQKYVKCYPQTYKYYQNLFNGKLGFKKVAEFKNLPQLKILNFKFEIDDSSADESFTVYDHPKIMIFKR